MLPYISIFITILLFSTIEVFSKLLGGVVDPFFIGFLRFFVAGVVLFLIDIKRVKQIEKKDWKFFIILGLVGITLGFAPYHFAINGLNASTSAVIFSMNPMFSSIFAIFILKESFNKNRVLGLIIGFIGVYIVCFGFKVMNFTNIKSVLLMLLSAISFGVYIAGAKPFVKKYGTFLTTGLIFIFGSLPYLFIINSFIIQDLKTSLPILLYLSLITTALAYFLYFYGLKRVPIIVGTSMFYLKPIFATIFAITILKELPSLSFYIGVLIILLGMTLTLKKK